MGEPMDTKVSIRLDFGQFPQAAHHINRIFGIPQCRDFVAWLRKEIFWNEAQIRSQAFGPSISETKANLQRLASEWRVASDTLCCIGPTEFALLLRAARDIGHGFETRKVVQELRQFAAIAEASAEAIRGRRAGRRKRAPALVALAMEIAESLSQAGAKPTTTDGGAFVEILKVVADSLDSSWPTKIPLKISAAELARDALSGK